MKLVPEQGIITALHGGLGNQLFEYAVARSISHRLEVPLFLDISGYSRGNDRTFLLNNFRHCGHLLGDDFIAPKPDNLVRRVARSIGIHPRSDLLKRMDGNPSHVWDQRLSKIAPGTYLCGWWFSEKYFSPIAETLRREFEFTHDAAGANLELLAEISSTHSVAVHIRRGDFVTNPNVARGTAKCSLGYYTRAANSILEQTRLSPTYYIFSDDLPWCRENFQLSGKMVFVDNNNECNCHEDLRLMSQCKHNIIANSTFSWWGAWLNKNPNKIVIAPKRWNTSSKHFDTHICPSYYSLIDN